MHFNKRFIIELIIALSLCITFTAMQDFAAPGPDAQLYHGLSDNLLSDTGYEDTIRNDYILPTIGHPLILSAYKAIGFNDGVWLSRILYFLCLLTAYLLTLVAGFRNYIRLMTIVLIALILPKTLIWGVELSLALSVILLWLSIIVFLKKHNLSSAILLGLAIAFNLLVRPMLAPLFYLCIPLVAASYFIYRKQMIKTGIAFSVSLLIFSGFRIYSVGQYGDARMVAGTYSEIPFYCAFNEYIPLNEVYCSSRWRDLPQDVYEEATDPLKLKTTWQDRAHLLKGKVKGFVAAHPTEALKGYLWRLKKFSIAQDKPVGTLLFLTWLAGLGLLIRDTLKNKKNWLPKLLIVSLPAYVILITSVFPYVGGRYLLTPNLYLLFSLLMILFYLDKKGIILEKG